MKGKDKDAAPQLSPSELRDLLAQATKGIAALATQSGETDQAGSDGKKPPSPKKNSGAKGSGKGKYRWYTGRKQDPKVCLLYTSPSPRDRTRSRMPSSA